MRSALDLAVTEAALGRPVGTARVFLALTQVDSHGDWSRLWLRTGYPASGMWAQARDPAQGDSGATWSGVALSDQLDTCLSLVAELSLGYRLAPVPVGALALALVADGTSGATQILLDNAEISHEALLDLIQDELLGVRLDGLTDFLTRMRGITATVAKPPVTPDSWYKRAAAGFLFSSPDDIELLGALVRDGQIDEKSNGELIASVVTNLAAEARRLGTRSARAVIEAARGEFDTVEPDGQQILFALADSPSPALAGLLSVAGISAPQVAAGAIERQEPVDSTPTRTVRTTVLTLINTFLLFAVLALVARHAVATGGWWEMTFLPGVLLGPPAVSAWFTVVLSIGLGFLDPLAGTVLAVEAVTSWLRERSERTALTAQTGVHLTLADQRKFRQRRSYTARWLRQRDTSLLPWRSNRLVSSVGRNGTLARGTR